MAGSNAAGKIISAYPNTLWCRKLHRN